MPVSEPVHAAADHRIPTLAAVLDPVQLSQHLVFFSCPPWNWGALKGAQVQVIKTHANRCTVEISLHTSGGLRALIGKVYGDDRGDVYRAMEAISRAGFGPDARFSIPQPLAFLPALNLLLQEKVHGARAKGIFMKGKEPDRAGAAERCALWLSHFQAVAPRSGPVVDVDRNLASLKEWKRPVAPGNEALADNARRLLGRLQDAAPGLRNAELCPGHGSYCYSQVVFVGDRTVTYDWDGHDIADPSRDVARFIVALKGLALRYLGSIRALDDAAGIFLKTYLGRDRHDVRKRLPFYEAVACVKLAKYEILRPHCHWRKTVIEGLINEGFRRLEQFT